MTTYIKTIQILPTMKPLDQPKKEEKTEEKAAEIECACFTCPSQKACKAAQEAGTPVEEKIDFSNVQIEPLFADFVDFETFSKSDFRAVKVLACEAVPKSKKLLKFTLDDGTGTDRMIFIGNSRVLRAGTAHRQNVYRHRQSAAPGDDGHRKLRYASLRHP